MRGCVRTRAGRPRTASSASPRNTIFWLCCMPRSTFTSRIFLSCTVLLPRHCGQRSFSLMTWPASRGGGQATRQQRARRRSLPGAAAGQGCGARGVAPAPLQSWHTACICCTMPGAIWRRWILTPAPWQPAQRPVLPDLLPFLWQPPRRGLSGCAVEAEARRGAPVAFGADDVLRQRQLLGAAVVELLQAHLQRVHDILSLASAATAAAAASRHSCAPRRAA